MRGIFALLTALPLACTACRSCEAVCPRQLKISEAMADFSAML